MGQGTPWFGADSMVPLGLVMSRDTLFRTKVIFYMAGLFASVGALVLACASKENEPSGQRWEEKVRGVQTRLVTRHNATAFPPKDFSERKVFTFNLQRTLIREDGKPVLFEGFLEDITKDGEQFAVHFTSRLSHDSSDDRTVRFHLKCPYKDVRRLLEKPPRYQDLSRYLFLKGIRKDFLVVCVVTEVERIKNYTLRPLNGAGSQKVDLDVESPDTFSAQGRLLEMVKYSDIYLDEQGSRP